MHRTLIGLLVLVLLLTACAPAPGGTVPPALPPASASPTVPVPPDLPPVAAPQIVSLRMFGSAGWAVTLDARLLRTFDGALTWFDVTPSDMPYYSLSPCYLDADHAWVVVMDVTRTGPSGYPAGMLYRTTDGGLTWESIPVEFSGSLYFIDAANGFALADLGAGAGSQYVAVYRTFDGGATWTQVFSHEPGVDAGLPASGMKSGLVFSDPNNGWIGGNVPMEDYLYFFRSRDGGANWARADLPLPAGAASAFYETQSPVFFSPSAGILPVRTLAFDGTSSFIFYRTLDGGETWTPGVPLPGVLHSAFVSPEQGWAVNASTLFVTVDGGVSWVPAGAAPAGTQFLRIEMSSVFSGWAVTVANPDDLSGLAVQRTDDGGATWIQVTP